MAISRGVDAVTCVETNYVKRSIEVLQLHSNNGKLTFNIASCTVSYRF
jgi:hypothetical protein